MPTATPTPAPTPDPEAAKFVAETNDASNAIADLANQMELAQAAIDYKAVRALAQSTSGRAADESTWLSNNPPGLCWTSAHVSAAYAYARIDKAAQVIDGAANVADDAAISQGLTDLRAANVDLSNAAKVAATC
jgi:hypothetical protein